MPTKHTLRFEQWQLDAKSEEEYHRLRKQQIEEEYKGISWVGTRDGLFEMEDPDWLLEDMIQQRGLTILHGDPGSGKSLIAMDWAYSLAHPDMGGWLGKKRDGLHRPMYLFTEGVSGLKKRTIAWEREHGVGFAPDITYVTTPVLMNPANGTSEQLSSLEKLYVDNDCDVLIIDTLANTMAGNENQQEDANSYLRTIRHFLEWGAVVLVHHNTKSGDEYRGSSVFKGAADTMVGVSMSEHGIIDLKITKQKDGDPRSGAMTLALREHSWLLDDKYERNSVALGAAEGPQAHMTNSQRILYQLVASLGGEVPLAVAAKQLDRDKRNIKDQVARMTNLEVFSPGGNKPVVIRVVQSDEPDTL